MANWNLQAPGSGSNNLLSPIAAERQQQRRKSTLTANGFFIDYSCTRRRSSAAVQQQHQLDSRNLLRVVNPVAGRQFSASFKERGGSFCAGQQLASWSRPSSPGRNSVFGPSSGARFDGSRKTSIFDPSGHSVLGAQLAAHGRRRRSTMITGAQVLAVTPTLVEPPSSAGRFSGQSWLSKAELAQRVPVIGCSPTSIGASLSALDETRRQEKLVRRFRRHQKRKEKQRRKQEEEPVELEWRRSAGNLRRRSVRAIKEVLQGRKTESPEDGLSVSSIDLNSISYSLSDDSLINEVLDNDELFEDENTLRNLSAFEEGHEKAGQKQVKRSLVRNAFKKLASGIGQRETPSQRPISRRKSTRASSIASCGGAAALSQQWYYYYYLRQNSIDTINDLPISSSGLLSESERRLQLHTNYSLARIKILNSSSNCPVNELAEQLVDLAEYPTQNTPTSDPFDFSQRESTDVSLALSTSTNSSFSSRLNESSLSAYSAASISDLAGLTRPSRRPNPKPWASTQSVRRSLDPKLSEDDERVSPSPRNRLSPATSRNPKSMIVSRSWHEPKQLDEAVQLISSDRLSRRRIKAAGGSSNQVSNAANWNCAQADDEFMEKSNGGAHHELDDELDDFERFNRSYRGYKKTDNNHLTSESIKRGDQKEANGSKKIKSPQATSLLTAHPNSGKHLEARNSKLRLSFKFGGVRRRKSESKRASSMSCDSLNASGSPQRANLGDLSSSNLNSNSRRSKKNEALICLPFQAKRTLSLAAWKSSQVLVDNDAYYHHRGRGSKSADLEMGETERVRDKRQLSVEDTLDHRSSLSASGSLEQQTSASKWTEANNGRARSHMNIVNLTGKQRSSMGRSRSGTRTSSVRLRTHRASEEQNKQMPNQCPSLSQIQLDGCGRAADNSNDKRNQAVLIKSNLEVRARAHSTGSGRACVLTTATRSSRDLSWKDDKWNNKLPVSFHFTEQVGDDEQNLDTAGNDTTNCKSEKSSSVEEEEDEEDEEEEEEHDKQTLELLKKSSFTCLLIGARQSGKRTIVKCFVKLLNEFMLAVEEYRKERSLAKLIDCTDRLQVDHENRRASTAVQRCSRINSWLGGANKLLNLPGHLGGSKRRLNSMCPPVRLISGELVSERRHTAIDQSFHSQKLDPVSSKDLLAAPECNLLSNNKLVCNKSDYDISYSSNQLQVPSVCSLNKQTSPICSLNRLTSDTVRQHRLQSVHHRVRPLISLKELNKRRVKVKFKTRRQLNDCYLQLHNQPDCFLVIYSINDRKSFEYARKLIGQIRSIKQEVPIVLVANKIDLERAKVVKNEEGRSLARKNACKYMEISCTIGFNLDNLLVGIRTQLILKHHAALNLALRSSIGKTKTQSKAEPTTQLSAKTIDKPKSSDNILVRFYKRYLNDNNEQNYDCDNFSKL